MSHTLTRPFGAFAAIILLAGTAQAQDADATRNTSFSLRPIAGAYVPTGDLRNQLKSAPLFGAQLGWDFHPNLALVGSFAWSPSKDKTTAFTNSGLFTAREETVDLYQYDLGVEARAPMQLSSAWTLAPYLGLGVGGRSYNYRDVSAASSQTNWSGYGSLGVELRPEARPLGVRLEVRDNVSAFKGLRGEYADRKARNDVQVTTGLAWHF